MNNEQEIIVTRGNKLATVKGDREVGGLYLTLDVKLSKAARMHLYDVGLVYLNEFTLQPEVAKPILEAMCILLTKEGAEYINTPISIIKLMVARCWDIKEELLKELIALM